MANEEWLFQILKFALEHVVADFKMRDALMLRIQCEEDHTRQLGLWHVRKRDRAEKNKRQPGCGSYIVLNSKGSQRQILE